MCRDCILNRRDFNGLAAAGPAGGIMAGPSALASDPARYDRRSGIPICPSLFQAPPLWFNQS